MKELSVSTSAYFINHSGFQINKDCTRDMLSVASFTEEGGEGVVGHFLFLRNKTIRLNAMLQTVLLHLFVYETASTLLNDSIYLQAPSKHYQFEYQPIHLKWITTPCFLIKFSLSQEEREKGRVCIEGNKFILPDQREH